MKKKIIIESPEAVEVKKVEKNVQNKPYQKNQ